VNPRTSLQDESGRGLTHSKTLRVSESEQIPTGLGVRQPSAAFEMANTPQMEIGQP
jgi:hypothetical protein